MTLLRDTCIVIRLHVAWKRIWWGLDSEEHQRRPESPALHPWCDADGCQKEMQFLHQLPLASLPGRTVCMAKDKTNIAKRKQNLHVMYWIGGELTAPSHFEPPTWTNCSGEMCMWDGHPGGRGLWGRHDPGEWGQKQGIRQMSPFFLRDKRNILWDLMVELSIDPGNYKWDGL